MYTPLIKQIRNSGGTFYTFSSSAEDMNFLINESDERTFAWSKFVLLDIPIENRPSAKTENYIQYDAIPGAFTYTDNKTAQDRLAESFQNYCLNVETLLKSQTDYQIDLKKTVSERVFFKWLKELGALRFEQANEFQQAGDLSDSRFIEEDSDNYNKVVQYIGEIDMVNSTKNNTNSYSEVYIHVPISHGNTDDVLFKTITDDNYKQNHVYNYITPDPVDSEFLVGRDSNDTHPAGLSLNAFYDSPNSTFTGDNYALKKQITDTDGTTRFIGGWYYDTPIDNAYITSNDFSDQHNDYLQIIGADEFLTKNISIKRSRLDGISVDFDETNYYKVATNPNIDSFGEYNQSSAGKPFKFNAVLIYYDVYDRADTTNRETNLFGVLFLNPPEAQSTGGSILPTLTKFKPNAVTGDNGNAWGLKLNLKIDLNANDAQIESVVNEYNTYSMELFLDAMSQLRRVGDSLDTTNTQFLAIKERVDKIDDYVYRTQNVQKIQKEVSELQNYITANQELFTQTSDIIKLINLANQEIQNIYNNITSIDVTYNLDVLKNGFGIDIQKINNQAKIKNILQEYTLGNTTKYSLADDFSIKDNKHEIIIDNLQHTQLINIEEPNYINKLFSINQDINIKINDKYISWENGKTIRFAFGTIYSNTNSELNINIYTDSTDKIKTGNIYGVKVNNFDISHRIFKMKKYSIRNVEKYIAPTIEITCINKDKLEFTTQIY